MYLIDSHAHLHAPKFDEDRNDVLDRARAAGVLTILDVGTDLPTSRLAVMLAEQHDGIYASVGVHPHDADTATPGTLEALRELARHPKVVAIGEIGLDYHYDFSPRSVQRQVFEDQLALAAELELPVVLHSRQAHEDVLAALQDWQGTGVFHSYAAGPERMDQILEMGFYLGIAGPVTFRKAEKLQAVVAAAPLDRLLVETDCPYMTPVPRRGHRNEPAYIPYTIEGMAQARGVPVEEIARATTENARRLFGIDG